MNSFLSTLLIITCCINLSFGQCGFYDIQNGTNISYVMKNSKGKVTGKQQITVKDYIKTDDGYSAIMSTKIYHTND